MEKQRGKKMKSFDRLCLLILTVALCGAFSLVPTPVYAEAHAEAKAEAKKDEGEKKEEKKDEKKDSKKDKGDSDITGGKFDGDPIYVHIQPVLLPMIGDEGAEQLVTIRIDVQVKNMGVADSMHSNMLRVKNAVFETLYTGFSDGTLRVGRAVNVTKVKTRLAKVLGKSVGRENIDEVLIQSIAQRML